MNEVKQIQMANMLLHGHDINSKPIEITKSMAEFAFELVKLDLKAPTTPLSPIPKRQMLKNAQEYFTSKLNPRPIHYYNPLTIAIMRSRNFKSVDELLQTYNSNGKYINPFSLPVKFTKDSQFYGLLVLQSAFYDDPKFLENVALAFKHIELSRQSNAITSACYLHEITHTQLESNKGSVMDYNNSELLCMFMELVYAYEASGEDTLRKIEVDKINYFFYEFDNLFKYYHENDGTIDEFDALKTSKYVDSTLKAFLLFQIYYNGTTSIKKEIFQFIQSVIDGKITLEDMLKSYSITTESSTNKELMKHFTRK